MMSAAGNAEQVSEETKYLGRRRKAFTLILAWASAYSAAFVLFQQMLQIARNVSPYIGYEVPLPMVSIYISSFIMLAGTVIVYIFRPSKLLINLVLATSVAFIIVHYLYIYTIFCSRSNELRIEVLPFIIKYISSSGHESLAIDLGQLILTALIIYSAVKIRALGRRK